MSLFSEWRDDIRCVFQRDPAARTTFEVLTTYPGVHAIMLYRLSNRLWRSGWRYPARLLAFVARLLSNVDIHPGATIGPRFFIDHGACVVIGETAEIGQDVTLYHGVTLGGTSWRKGKRHPTLGDGVLVGAGAKILGPITVGNQARVGANSVVVQDVPEGCTVVGIPGKVVKLREAGQLNPYGFDLDHHLIPDPVGKAIACLLERIDGLEKRLEQGGLVAAGSQQQFYQGCSPDNAICESDCAGGAVAIGRRRPAASRSE
ncbi:serine O-acetyltransferase [Pseudomonas oryzae]|uniref:Serine acetyltransferase n=1 Tax=Pseudomonas oryzae TaxID=1392877 RepID=A0A1H1LTG4_9PSED|nr:serine O-acetyltransferase [Pseudomonas oryzae]SDR77914.1 serine O-acetyltransferase [Pseudomonas oryzae]